MIKEGDVLKDRYRVIGYVGSGGQRRVFRAIDQKASAGNRDVVIKEMFRGKSFKKDLVNAELTQQEVRILIQFPHPCIPRVLDLWMDRGTYYLIQEYIEGKTLKEYIHDRKVLGEGEAISLILQVADAVDYLHSQDPPIIIRDLKPSNVIVRHGRPFVVDLGGAQSESAVGTDIEHVSVSTRGYAPPEGVRDRGATTVDVYSAGVMLFQMLTGYDPVANPGALPGIRRVKPDVHPRLARIVSKATHWDKRRRYPSMLQLVLDLEGYQKQRDGARLAAATEQYVWPGLSLLLIVATLGAAGASAARALPGPPPPHALIYAALGVAMWALAVHALWRHWLATITPLNSLSRRLHRRVGRIRLVSLLIGVDCVALAVLLARLLS